MDELWAELCDAGLDEYFDPPYVAFPDDPIYGISTRPGFIFDDNFWDVFHSLKFHICHVAYYGPERLLGRDPCEDIGTFDLRFKEEKDGS